MEDEFTEFRSGEVLSNFDLLGLNNLQSGKVLKKSSESLAFTFEDGELEKRPVGKKKIFVFPYDLDLNADNLKKIASSEANNSKYTPWDIMENIEELNVLAKKLVENGRLIQALRCKKHTETVGEMVRIKEIKRIAAEREDYDTAIQYRNLLNTLEKQLCNAEEIQEWLNDYSETTLADLESTVKKTMGPEAALEFHEKFSFPDIEKSSDIEASQSIFSSAQHYIQVKSILKDQSAIFFQQSQQVLQKVNEELSKAITILYKLRPHFSELTEDLDLQTYIKAIPEVYYIGIKLSKIISFCNSTKNFEKILQEISHNWEECKDFLKVESFDCKSEKDENICGLCLFSSKNLVMLCSSYFHVACINFWINRISTEPPKLDTAVY